MTEGERTAFEVWVRLLGRALGSFTRADVNRALLDGENLYPRPATPIKREEAYAVLSVMVSRGELSFDAGQYAVIPRAPLPSPEPSRLPVALVRVGPVPFATAPRGQMGLDFGGTP